MFITTHVIKKTFMIPQSNIVKPQRNLWGLTILCSLYLMKSELILNDNREAIVVQNKFGFHQIKGAIQNK